MSSRSRAPGVSCGCTRRAPTCRASLARSSSNARFIDMSDCLFCRIVAGSIPAKEAYRDDSLVAFRDINPQAPLHVLIIPTKHVSTLNDLSAEDDTLVGSMLRLAAAIAAEHGYGERGYR